MLATSRNLLLGAALLALLLVISSRITAEPIVRHPDFLAYWSAAYLLADSQDAHDRTLLLAVEQEHTGWQKEYAVFVWNPPWLLALLLPLAWLPYFQAVWFWMLLNIVLFFVASVLLWVTLAQTEAARRLGWLGTPITFFFAPTLLTLVMGQINTLVLVGLAAFFYFYKREQLGWAGMALALTTVKPHLVYLTLPLIVWLTWQRRQWRVWLGFAALLLGLTTVVLLFRPTFLSEYAMGVGNGRLLTYNSPTIGGILHSFLGWQWAKLIGIVLLPLGLWFLGKWGDQMADADLIGWSLLLSVSSAPFGWSYDQIVLLFPLFQIVLWIGEGRLRSKRAGYLLLLLLVGINLLTYYLRLQNVHEVYYFWVPLSLLLLYSWAYQGRNDISLEQTSSLPQQILQK